MVLRHRPNRRQPNVSDDREYGALARDDPRPDFSAGRSRGLLDGGCYPLSWPGVPVGVKPLIRQQVDLDTLIRAGLSEAGRCRWCGRGWVRKHGADVHELRLMGGVGRDLVVVGAVFGVVMLSVGAASADGPVQLSSRLGDVCLDAPSGSWLTAVVINPCNGTDFQRWNLNGRQLESVAFSGECLG